MRMTHRFSGTPVAAPTLDRPPPTDGGDHLQADEQRRERDVPVPGGAAQSAAAPRPRPPWPASLIVAGIAIAVLIALFHDTAWSMARQWTTSAYGHGFLIAPVSAFLIWRRRAVLAAIPPRPQLWGMVPVLFLAGIWLLGSVANVRLVQQFALVAMIPAFVLTIFGWPVAKAIAFPLLFLLFAVPAGSFLIPPLQDVTAEFALYLLRLTGIPVYSDGLMIHIPSGSFVVAEACAGVRYLISTVVLGFLAAHLMYRSWWRRLLFLGLAFVVPIVANGFRAYGIIMIAHLSDYRLAIGVDHILYGWVFLSLVTLCLLAIGMTFREPGSEPFSAIGASTVTAAGRPSSALFFTFAAAGALLAAASAPAYAALMQHRAPESRLASFAPLDVRPPWTPAAADEIAWRPHFPGADRELMRAYTDGERRVVLYLAYYARQRQGAEVVSGINRFAGGERPTWLRTGRGRQKVIIGGTAREVRYLALRASDRGLLVWSWYWVNKQMTADRISAKLLEMQTKLLGGEPGAAVLAVAAEYSERPEEAIPVLQDFVDHAWPLTSVLEADRAPSDR